MPSLLKDEEPREDDKSANEALVIDEDSKAHGEDVWRSRPPDLRYAITSSAKVILPSFKEASRGQTTRRVRKKGEVHGDIKSVNMVELLEKNEACELNEEQTMSRGQEKKKVRNGRAEKIQ